MMLILIAVLLASIGLAWAWRVECRRPRFPYDDDPQAWEDWLEWYAETSGRADWAWYGLWAVVGWAVGHLLFYA